MLMPERAVVRFHVVFDEPRDQIGLLQRLSYKWGWCILGKHRWRRHGI